MSSTGNPNLKEQYHEAQEMQRKLLELFWQEPSVIVAIAGAVVIASYHYITDTMIDGSVLYQILRFFLVGFGTIMSWASFQTAIKHRFWRRKMLDKIKDIEKDLDLTPLPLQRQAASDEFRFYEKVSSEWLLIVGLLVLSIGFTVLSGYNVIDLVTRLLDP